MARIAMIFGLLLAALGVVLYVTSEKDPKPPTALIPSAFGACLIILGLIAEFGSAKARKHSMHAAAVVGLVGLVSGIVLVIVDVTNLGANKPPSNLAMGGKAVFGLLSGVFLALCVKSFIDIRRARKQAQATSEPAK